MGFSVIIPAFNEAEHLGRCLEGLAAQGRGQSLIEEVIVVDNLSTDDTARVAEALGARVVSAPKGTIASVRNRGAEAADGEIFAFIDADCVPLPGWLVAAHARFEEPGTVAVGAYPRVPEDATWVQSVWSRLCQGGPAAPAAWLPSANMLVRRSAFREVGGFNEELITCEDVDLSYRLGRLGTVFSDPAAAVIHHREPATLGRFFTKEVWHSRDNYTGLRRHGLVLRELPSLVMPLLFTLGVVLAPLTPWLGPVGWMGAALALAVPGAYTVRALLAGHRDVISVFVIYLVYFAARGWSAIKTVPPALAGRRPEGSP